MQPTPEYSYYSICQMRANANQEETVDMVLIRVDEIDFNTF